LLVFDPLPPACPGEHPSNRRRAYNHLAFRVDGIASVTECRLGNGVKFLSEEMNYVRRRLRFFAGPEGLTWNSSSESNRTTTDARTS
jgi:hypothetical protein